MEGELRRYLDFAIKSSLAAIDLRFFGKCTLVFPPVISDILVRDYIADYPSPTLLRRFISGSLLPPPRSDWFLILVFSSLPSFLNYSRSITRLFLGEVYLLKYRFPASFVPES